MAQRGVVEGRLGVGGPLETGRDGAEDRHEEPPMAEDVLHLAPRRRLDACAEADGGERSPRRVGVGRPSGFTLVGHRVEEHPEPLAPALPVARHGGDGVVAGLKSLAAAADGRSPAGRRFPAPVIGKLAHDVQAMCDPLALHVPQPTPAGGGFARPVARRHRRGGADAG